MKLKRRVDYKKKRYQIGSKKSFLTNKIFFYSESKHCMLTIIILLDSKPKKNINLQKFCYEK